MFAKTKRVLFEEENELQQKQLEDRLRPTLPIHIKLNWPVLRCIKYGVQIRFGSETDYREVKYEINITRKENTEEHVVFEINRAEVFVDQITPDLVADKLAYETGKAIYPIQLGLDFNGEFETIVNHEDIVKRWPQHREKLEEYFEGEVANTYFDQMEEHLQSIDQINTSFLNRDWFIQTFFKPIYKNYSTAYEAESIFRFPNIDNYSIPGYQTEEKLSNTLNDFGAITIEHIGQLMEDELEEEIIEGDYKASYLLHPINKIILSYVAHFTHSNKEDIEVKIFIIPSNRAEFLEFENQDSIDALFHTEPAIESDKQVKRGFWEKLFG